ncbi:MAG: sulfotransferase [Methylobacter sp.]
MNENFSANERALLRGQDVPFEQLASLSGWYPVVARNDKLWWRFFGEKRFSEPFFYNSVSSLNQDKRLCVQTAFNALDAFENSLTPTAFIFHTSRCGSTLLSQLLASLPSCIVLSEPPIIDSYLSLYHAQPEQNGAEKTLRQLVGALGQKRFAEERHFFIKLDSWHIKSLPLFRKAFPDTPFIFMYRKPEEVLASHQRQRGPQMVPGLVDSALLELDPEPLSPGDLDGYCVKVLAHFFSAACRQTDELILLNYNQLPQIVWSELLDLFSIAHTLTELAAMKSRSGLHSKNAGKFAGDPQPAAYRAGSELCATIYPYYEKLEQLRLDRMKQGVYAVACPANG